MNLSVCEDVGLPMDMNKVDSLSREILLQPDPSQFCLTVVPEDCDTFIKENAITSMYKVIHGRHRCLALQKILSEGNLPRVLSMEEGFVQIFILSVSSVKVKNYIFMKGNDIAAKYTKKNYSG